MPTKKTKSKTSKKRTTSKNTKAKQTAAKKQTKLSKTAKSKKLSDSSKKAPESKVMPIEKEKETIKESKSKKIILPIIILLIVLLMWFLRDQIIVAMVNGKPITRFQVIKELENQGASQILDSIVTIELVNQAIDEAKVEIDEQAVADQLAEIEESLSAQDQNLDDILAMQNLTREDVEEDIRLNLQVDKILADKIQVSEEEIKEYFETNKEILGEEADFEEMREDIEAQLTQEKRAQAQQEWLESLRSEANIRYLRFEPTSLF
jgi:foldase protein PrsA